MDYGKLRFLIDKYYMGETSREEEDYIRKCLDGDDIPSEFITEKHLFDSFSSIREKTAPGSSLDQEIIRMIDTRSSDKIRYPGVMRWVAAAAAVILVLIGVNFYNRGNTMKDTFSDEQQAYVVTEKVLTYISQTMNSEAVKLEELNHLTGKISAVNNLQKINKTIDNIKNRKK